MKRTFAWLKWGMVATLVSGMSLLQAAEITADEARGAATAWLAKSSALKGVPTGVRTLVDFETGATLHAVDLRGGGYVVTAADDLRGPVLAFSDRGTFEDDPRNPLWLLARGDAWVCEAEAADVAARGERTKTQKAWDNLLGRNQPAHRLLSALPLPTGGWVGRKPLVATRWGQTTHNGNVMSAGGLPCFDYYVPPFDDKTGDRAPCGCVATAGAQVMRFFRFPEKAVVRTFEVGEYGRTVRRSTSGESYRWDEMPDDVQKNCSTAARKAIGRLTRDVGIACESNYVEGETSASAYDLAERLKDVFGYGNAQWFDYESPDAFRRDLIPNLDAGSPVVLSIYGYWAGGHAVVVDGYAWNADMTEFYVSVNMGWQDYGSGWYVPPDFDYDPYDYPFTSIEGFVGNIFPGKSGQIVSGRILGARGLPVSGASVSLKSGSTVVATLSTDDRGVYWFIEAGGRYVVEASAGSATAAAEVEIVEGENTMADIHLALSDAVAKPTIGFSRGFATVGCATAGSTVRYTCDGTEPDGESDIYDAQIPIAGQVTVRARAFRVGMQASATASLSVGEVVPDDFDQAWGVSAAKGKLSLRNVDATLEPGESLAPGNWECNASVWMSFRPSISGGYWFTVSGYDDVGYMIIPWLVVYRGDRIGDLTRVADGTTGGVLAGAYLEVNAGETYRIALDSNGSSLGENYRGTFELEWDNCDTIAPEARIISVSRTAGSRSVTIHASSEWHVTDCSDWMSVTRDSGRDGENLVFSFSANETGEARTGVILLQAGTSDIAEISVSQLPPGWYDSKDAAVAEAKESGKRLLLVYGRDTCGNTTWTRECLTSDPEIRQVVDESYVCWYCNCDGSRAGEASAYLSGLGGFTLPAVCVIDPANPDKYLYRTTGWQSAATIKGYLESYRPPFAGYMVKFDSNGGSGTPPTSLRCLTERIYALPSNVFNPPPNRTRFAGWFCSKNGRRYDDGMLVFDLAEPGETVTMTAIWE